VLLVTHHFRPGKPANLIKKKTIVRTFPCLSSVYNYSKKIRF
jgi:hypothetical protein